MVWKQDGFTHILLSTKSSENDSLNPEVRKELQSALRVADADDSKLVLLSAWAASSAAAWTSFTSSGACQLTARGRAPGWPRPSETS